MDEERQDVSPEAPKKRARPKRAASPPVTARPRVPTAAEAARRWGEAVTRAAAEPRAPKPERSVLALLVGLERSVARIERNLDHLHTDVAAIREVERIPRPECYPPPPKRKGRAERAQEEER